MGETRGEMAKELWERRDARIASTGPVARPAEVFENGTKDEIH